jgi:nucleotide-binding universal stress UspA family protein
MEKLLVFGDDQSVGADTAWEWLCAQKWAGWRVQVLTVEQLSNSNPTASPARTWQPEHPRLAPPETEISGVEYLVAKGKPQDVLSAVEADLVVVGPRGAGIRKKMHLGSVAEALILSPTSPVIVARGNSTVKNVILAVDGSTHAAAAMQFLGSMPWITNVHVSVIAVDEGDGVGAQATRDAGKYFEDMGVSVNTVVKIPHELDLTINVCRDLDEFVANTPCDLVAMGTQGLRGVSRLRLGSVASHVAHHVDCSILLIRAQSSE